MKVMELIEQMTAAKTRREDLAAMAQDENRCLTASERLEHDAAYNREQSLAKQIEGISAHNFVVTPDGQKRSLFGFDPIGMLTGRTPGVASAARNERDTRAAFQPVMSRSLSADYSEAFAMYLRTNGTQKSAALYEGSNGAGGFAVPITVEGQVVPLAPSDTGVRSIATVIPTANDIKLPRQTAISTAAAKAEGDGTGTKVFTESEPTLDQFTLSAYMAGVLHQISWELAQDVPAFQEFAVSDMLLAQSLYEETLFVSGSGSGQAQGLKGNTAVGVTGVLAGTDNYASELLQASYDVQGLLKGSYFANASWLMNRSTGVLLRKAQQAANLFLPVWTRENGKDYFHGFPVTYSTSMDAVGASKTPIVFGDFKAGYVIGDRGGAGVNVKILDQPKATEGIVQLLCYRRTDGRVRRSEALQAITLHS